VSFDGELMGKSWENHGKIMGKSWENHGKMMEHVNFDGKWMEDGFTFMGKMMVLLMVSMLV
jgi:hypothetical protein